MKMFQNVVQSMDSAGIQDCLTDHTSKRARTEGLRIVGEYSLHAVTMLCLTKLLSGPLFA